MTSHVANAPLTESGDGPELAAGRQVLQTEARALVAMADGLDGAFINAVDAMDGVAGRIIVTGMGKSGHVARKIAATLASTGTPAFFVHPAEASHGDLGMITQEDGVLALSNSGETSEMSDIVAHSRRIGVPLIAMTRRDTSTLAEAADVVLLLPETQEACPHGLAPTTSTTAAMALGDALAVALLDRRGFTMADFRQLHPGGSLGKRLLKVADLMHAGDALPLIGPDHPMSDVLLVMTQKGFGCAAVGDDQGRLLGVITDGDLRRHMGPALFGLDAAGVMTANPVVIDPQALAQEAVAVMNERGITTLFVADAGRKVVGLLHIHDLLRAGIS